MAVSVTSVREHVSVSLTSVVMYDRAELRFHGSGNDDIIVKSHITGALSVCLCITGEQ